MSLRSRLKEFRNVVVQQGLGERANEVPDRYLTNFACVGGASEQVYVLEQMLGEGSSLKILVVGVFGGRDFWALRLLGHDVSGFDLEDIPDCPPTTKGDAEEVWPFPDQSYDVVVMGEILEHLIMDRSALLEARRVLKRDGFLIGTVPFLHEKHDYHVRIHTPATIRRLLNVSGFVMEEIVERPALVSLRHFNALNHSLAFTCYAFSRKSIYGPLGRAYGRFEWSLGRQRWVPRKLLKVFGLINWGCTFRARPTGDQLDYKAVNRQEFCAPEPTKTEVIH